MIVLTAANRQLLTFGYETAGLTWSRRGVLDNTVDWVWLIIVQLDHIHDQSDTGDAVRISNY